MNRKELIRTYGRKKKDIPLSDLHPSLRHNTKNENTVSLNKRSDEIAEKQNVLDSSDYDPFDTTFDRILKKTRPVLQKTKLYNSKSCSDSTNDTSGTSEDEIMDPVSPLHVFSNSPKVQAKHALDGKGSLKKTRVDVVRRRLVKRTTRKEKKTSLKVEIKVKKLDVQRSYKTRKTGKKGKIKSTDNLGAGFLKINPETRISNSNVKQNDFLLLQKQYANEKYTSDNNEKNCDILNLTGSIQRLELKPCSVILNDFNKLKRKEKDINNTIPDTILLGDSQDYRLISDEMSDDIDKSSNNNTNISYIKHCFVKMQRLDQVDSRKSVSFKNNFLHMVSSTPIGKMIKSCSLVLSPITKQLNTVDTCTDRNLQTIDNSTKLNDIPENRSTRSPTAEISKSTLDQSTELNSKSCVIVSEASLSSNKASAHSLLTISNIENAADDTHESSIQSVLTSAECTDSMKDCKKTIEIDVSKDDLKFSQTQVYIQMCEAEKVKNVLNFSTDIDGSRSLFDDTKASVQYLVHNTSANVTNESLASNLTCGSQSLNRSSMLIKTETSCSDEDSITDPSDLNTDLEVEEKSPKISINIENISRTGSPSLHNSNHLGNDSSIISSKIVDQNTSIQPCHVMLMRLEDPVRITKRRKQYPKWNLDLASISEDNDNPICIENRRHVDKEKENNEMGNNMLGRSVSAPSHVISNTNVLNIEKRLYLKPGKSWARSLSILNRISNDFNLDKLAIGKGKNWRHSVKAILDMQREGILQSCIQNHENEKEAASSHEIIRKSEHVFANNRARSFDYQSVGRHSRRVSIRVVPNDKSVKCIEDVPFLEAYGIIPTTTQRLTLIDPNRSSICNIGQNNISCIPEEHVAITAKNVILQRCSQDDYLPFSECFSDTYIQHCRKIGEGVYGEVFLYETEHEKSVIKIIPIEGNEQVNGEPQKKFDEILSEIVIAKELHNLRFNKEYNTDGFVEVKNIKCIIGNYPQGLIELWNIYDEEKRSDNDSPVMFKEDQLYIVLELSHGGQDLEAFVFYSAEEAYILFIQAALALAVAEKAVEFEHRDLHWGNVLISRTDETSVHYKLGDNEIRLPSRGVKVSIIDFTLSRISYQGCSIFNDLATDPALFTAQGEYQFEIYRLMRDRIQNDWQQFEPYTNILWLHYTLDKMITAVRYKRKSLKVHKNAIIKLEELKEEILMYNSSYDFVTNCDKLINTLYNGSKTRASKSVPK